MGTPSKLDLTALSCFAFFLLIACTGCVPFSDNTVRGEIKNRTDWPDPIVNLVDRLENDNPDDRVQGYLLVGSPGRHSIEHAIFRISNVSPEIFETISTELELVETDEDMHAKWWHRNGIEPPPIEWWTLQASRTSIPYASQRRLDGDEGDLYYASYEPTDRKLFIEYYFNF